MDEPTNHLDLPARNWLEEYLADYPGLGGARLPRPLLPRRHGEAHHRGGPAHPHRLPRQLLEVRGRAPGRAWSACARRTAARREEIEKAEAFINRFRYQATKARQVQSRIKQLDKVERIEIPAARKKIRFKFPDAPKPGRVVLELKGVRKVYGDNVVLDGRRPPGRARRPHRPRGPERRRQVDPHAHPGRRRPARLGHAARGPPGRHRLLRPGPGRGPRTPSDTIYEEMSVDEPHDHGADDPQHPRRLPLLGRRRHQEGARSSREASATAWPWPRCS